MLLPTIYNGDKMIINTIYPKQKGISMKKKKKRISMFIQQSNAYGSLIMD